MRALSEESSESASDVDHGVARVGEARCPEGEEGSIKMIRDDLKMSSRLNLGSVNGESANGQVACVVVVVAGKHVKTSFWKDQKMGAEEF